MSEEDLNKIILAKIEERRQEGLKETEKGFNSVEEKISQDPTFSGWVK